MSNDAKKIDAGEAESPDAEIQEKKETALERLERAERKADRLMGVGAFPPALARFESIERKLNLGLPQIKTPWADLATTLAKTHEPFSRLNSAAGFASAFEGVRSFQEKMNSWMRPPSSMFAFEKALGEDHRMFGGALMNLQRQLASTHRLGGLDGFGDIIKGLGHDKLLSSFEPFFRVQKQFADIFPSGIEKSLGLSAIATLSAFDRGLMSNRTAFLAGLDTHRSIASLGWPAEEEESCRVGVVLPQVPHHHRNARPITIEASVTCAICGKDLPVIEHSHLVSEDGIEILKLRLKLRLFPLCSSCVEEAGGSPEFWDNAWRDLTQAPRPTLALVPGGGEGTGTPDRSDHLRIVKLDEEPESEE